MDAAGQPKIALVYHDNGDKKRLPFLNNLVELMSLVEPKVSCEIVPVLQLVVEEQVHVVWKVAIFLFSEDTDFPAFPMSVKGFFNIQNENDLLIVSQRNTPIDSIFPAENVFMTKNLVKNANEWCPAFFQKLFPKTPADTAATNDVVFVCDSSSKADVQWCKVLVNKIRSLGGQAVCPGCPEWTSADVIMGNIQPTTLVVLVVRKDGLELLMKFGPLIATAKERAKVVIASKDARKISPDLKGSDVGMYSKEHPIDLWLGILCHLSLVSCNLPEIPGQDATTGFVMPFAREKVKAITVVESGDCDWKTVLLIIFAILFVPIVIALYVVAILYGIDLTKLSNLGKLCQVDTV